MAKPGGYVKRFKSLSLLVLGATLLFYDIANSGRELDADFDEAQRLFLITSLVHAKVPGNGLVAAVDGKPAADWLQNIDRIVPDRGPVINVINSWNMPTLRADGSFSLSNGEAVAFSRLPRNEVANVTDSARTPDSGAVAQCPGSQDATCHLYSIQPVGGNISYEALLVYDVDPQHPTTSRKKTWRYVHDESGALATIQEAESKVVRIASAWTGSPKNPETAYLALREKSQQRTARIPVINLEVKAPRAALFFSVFALIVSALMTHSLLAISESQVKSIDEPWIVQTSGLRPGCLASRLQSILSLGGALVIAVTLWCPVAIIGLAIGVTHDRIVTAILCVILAVAAMVVLASTVKFASIVAALHHEGD